MADEQRVLAATVHMGGQVYKVGETPPPEVAEQITNPKAWAQPAAPAADDGDDTDGDVYAADTEPTPRRRRRTA